MSKKLIDGCDCGCRGDFEITEKGRIRILELLGLQKPRPDKILMNQQDLDDIMAWPGDD